MITIKEMANMLGISTTTVSNVIHGKTGEVSPATIEKVQKMLEEYDYVPNINARNLASNKSGIIGVAMVNRKRGYSNYLQDAFIGELVGSIERALRSSGYFMMMYFSENAEDLIRTVYSWNVDGMIIFGVQREDYQTIHKKFKKPQVFIDSYIDEIQVNCVNIGLDDRRGGYLMTKYLLSKGHKKIAYLADNFKGSDYERYCGFAAAMNEAHIMVGKHNFIKIRSEEHNLSESLNEICDRTKEFTALFCASDYYALMVMNSLRDRGIHVPDDISVCGFDDNMYSRFSRPAITTIHQSASEKGELAVKYMMEQLQGKKIESNWIVLPVELVERDTVKDITGIINM